MVVSSTHGNLATRLAWDGIAGSAYDLQQSKRALVIEGEHRAGFASPSTEHDGDFLAGSGPVHLGQAAAERWHWV